MSRVALVVVAAFVALGCTSTGEKTDCSPQARAAIVNGTAQELYLALGVEDTRALVRLYDGSGFTVSSCTGTLIRREWLITARHCLEIERLVIDLRIEAESRILEVRERVPHPDFDVALIRFEPALAEEDAVRPFALETTPVNEDWLGERVELAGFGITDGGILPTDPRYAVEAIREIRNAAIVVDGLGRSGGCLGDSGGPLLVRNDRGRPAVFGILSTGSATCLHHDTYVRIDQVAEWVEAVAAMEDSDPVPCGAIGKTGICSFGRALVCRDGVLEVNDCEGGTVCGWNPAGTGFGCVIAADDPCSGVGSAGACEAGIARECQGGVVFAHDCGPCDRCGYDPSTGRPKCYSE